MRDKQKRKSLLFKCLSSVTNLYARLIDSKIIKFDECLIRCLTNYYFDYHSKVTYQNHDINSKNLNGNLGIIFERKEYHFWFDIQGN